MIKKREFIPLTNQTFRWYKKKNKNTKFKIFKYENYSIKTYNYQMKTYNKNTSTW
jgi:hypothetical protein